MYIPIPIPKAAKKPALLPYRFTCLIMIAVSGPGLVRAIRCAIDDKNFKTFVFGNNHKEFKKNIKNKITLKHSKYLKDILNEIFFDLKDKNLKKNIIFFSPAGASFDSFKNFEDRGKYFNQLIKKFLNAKQQLFI